MEVRRIPVPVTILASYTMIVLDISNRRPIVPVPPAIAILMSAHRTPDRVAMRPGPRRAAGAASRRRRPPASLAGRASQPPAAPTSLLRAESRAAGRIVERPADA